MLILSIKQIKQFILKFCQNMKQNQYLELVQFHNHFKTGKISPKRKYHKRIKIERKE